MIQFATTTTTTAAATVAAAVDAAAIDTAVDTAIDTAVDTATETSAATASATERLGDEIARLAAHLHAATYRLLVLIHDFDEREGWGDGFRSCAHWLSWRTGIAPGAAREKVRVARALASLPRVSAAMERGALSFSKVRAMTRVATAENEGELVELAAHATAARMEKIVHGWRRVDRLDDAEAERARHESRDLRIHQDDDGMFVVRGRLDPEVGAVLEKALEWAEDQLYRHASVEERREVTVGQRRADAVGLLAEKALAESTVADDRAGSRSWPMRPGQPMETAKDPPVAEDRPAPDRPIRRADRFQVVLHVGGGAPQVGGLNVSAETSRRLACDAGLVVMTHEADGGVLDVGRKRRTVPAALRRALEVRDEGCSFPGCGVRHTDAHHITHWADGGETKLDNLVLACRRHHRALHEGGWTVRLDAEGRAVFHRPDGRPVPEVPLSPPVPTGPAVALERANQSLGIDPDPWAATPDWVGESLDLGLAIDMLREAPGEPTPRGSQPDHTSTSRPGTRLNSLALPVARLIPRPKEVHLQQGKLVQPHTQTRRCSSFRSPVLTNIAKIDYGGVMTTMNISLPDSLKTFVEEQVAERQYSTSSEYMRELIRRDQDRTRLRGLLLDGAASAPGSPADDGYFDGLRDRVRRPVQE